jgi:hypothetical protein
MNILNLECPHILNNRSDPSQSACIPYVCISPEEEGRRQAMETDIEAILAHPVDPAVYGETERCLGDNEYRSYRVLGDRRMLFEGRGDKLWINTLRSSCPDRRRDAGKPLVHRQAHLRGR